MCTWRRIERVMWKDKVTNAIVLHIYFASAAVAVDSSHMTASSSISWSRFSPPSNFVNGHVSMLQTVNAAWCSVMFRHMLRNRAYTEKAAAPGLSLMPTVALCALFHSKECSLHVHKPTEIFFVQFATELRSTMYVTLADSMRCLEWSPVQYMHMVA